MWNFHLQYLGYQGYQLKHHLTPGAHCNAKNMQIQLFNKSGRQEASTFVEVKCGEALA